MAKFSNFAIWMTGGGAQATISQAIKANACQRHAAGIIRKRLKISNLRDNIYEEDNRDHISGNDFAGSNSAGEENGSGGTVDDIHETKAGLRIGSGDAGADGNHGGNCRRRWVLEGDCLASTIPRMGHGEGTRGDERGGAEGL